MSECTIDHVELALTAKFCPECGLKLPKPVEVETDYITLLACTNPRRALVAWMVYDKPSDSYTMKKCSDALSLRGAQALADSWAAALKLEIR